MGYGAHAYEDDPRNADILISVNGELLKRNEATVSVFDSGFVLGDGVWEGLRLHKGGVPFLRAHLTRLYEGARTLDFEGMPPPEKLVETLFACIDANGMQDGVHIRLMVSRGVKATPYQDPRVTITPPTIVIIPEHKHPTVDDRGITLFTSAFRRTGPDQQDQKMNSHSKLNCIQACIQAAKAGADEALMLDPQGFVATCNSTHFFIVRRGEVWTSSGDYCLGGITRGNIIRLCEQEGIPILQKNFSLTDVYGSEEAFVTGTFAGVSPVRSVDGRALGDPLGETPAVPGPMVVRLRAAYRDMIAKETTRHL